jgi:hypothetical protein
VALWYGGIDEMHHEKKIAAEGINSEKGRLVRSLFWLTTKRKKSEKSKRWNLCKLNPKGLT